MKFRNKKQSISLCGYVEYIQHGEHGSLQMLTFSLVCICL